MGNLENLVDYRTFHSVVRKPFTAEQLKQRAKKDNVLTEKVVISLDTLLDSDRHTMSKHVSKQITGNDLGLDNVQYKVAGRTTSNEVILKVTGKVI